MTPQDALVAIAIGFVAGTLSGLFGVGGGIVMTPGIQIGIGASPIVSLATPLPVILPTALTGALTYRRAGEVDSWAARWIVVAGIPASVVGALLTQIVNTHLLLVVTAALLGYQAVGLLRTSTAAQHHLRATTWRTYSVIGILSGLVSGLLGIGGGLVIVPLLAGWIGMPLKRALGTSLLSILVLVIPGTIVHSLLGHIDWPIFVLVTMGAVPGAWFGAHLALGARETMLRRLVGGFLLVVAIWYGLRELLVLLWS
jgi:uncharacterized membrane protein YfcA